MVKDRVFVVLKDRTELIIPFADEEKARKGFEDATADLGREGSPVVIGERGFAHSAGFSFAPIYGGARMGERLYPLIFIGKKNRLFIDVSILQCLAS